jgi:L-asparaginase II
VSIPLLCTTRDRIVERLERGHCAISTPRGELVWSAGDPDHETYLRSSAKPAQATALVLSGAIERFSLRPEHLAVGCGSHHGEQAHVATVLEMLERAGVPAQALQCGAHGLREPDADRLARASLTPTPLHNNCSGKHAAMLCAARALGAPLATYLASDHPVQRTILASMARCADLPERQIAVGLDGCTAPNFAMPIRHMARFFASLAAPGHLPADLAGALCRIAAAMRAHPFMVGGTGSFDTVLMRDAPIPLIAKGGAAGLQCVAIPSLGLGVAVKAESGNGDHLPSVIIAILRALGVLPGELPPSLAAFDRPAVRNHRGLRVGETRVLLDTAPLAGAGART